MNSENGTNKTNQVQTFNGKDCKAFGMCMAYIMGLFTTKGCVGCLVQEFKNTWTYPKKDPRSTADQKRVFEMNHIGIGLFAMIIVCPKVITKIKKTKTKEWLR